MYIIKKGGGVDANGSWKEEDGISYVKQSASKSVFSPP